METKQITPHEHRVWAEIDLDALVYNYRQAQKAAGGSVLMPVVKADAYGHGAVPAARALAAAGAQRFAVATAEEALQLRRHRISQPILLMGMVPARWAPVLAKQRVAMAVGSLENAKTYAAQLNGETLKVHIKLDTGMGRIGLPAAGAVQQALAIAKLPGLEVEGIFTHFSSADDAAQDDFTAQQAALFTEICDALAEKGLAPLRHVANSAAVVAHGAARFDMVRPGILLYGSNPRGAAGFTPRQPMSLRAAIVQVKEVEPGQGVSYGHAWHAERKTRVATLGIGYADGLMRCLSGKIEALVGGRRVPQIGRICMDMCMLDVSGLPGVKAGDTATLLGADGGEFISADEMAKLAGTISYEVLCAVGRRVPRLYYQGGRLVEECCYVEEL